MIRCRIAWMSDFENVGLEASQEVLAQHSEIGETYEADTEGEIFEKLFTDNWTGADSISVWEHGVEGVKYRVVGTWIVEASSAAAATAAVEDAVNRCGLNVELDSCDAEEE